MTAIISLGGDRCPLEIYSNEIIKDSLLIGVDKGVKYLLDYGYTPDLLIGDLDSIDIKILNLLKDKNIKIIEYDTDKDITDGELACKYARESGASKIVLLSANSKNSLDHYLGNIFLLKKYPEAVLISEYFRAIYIDSSMGKITIQKALKASFIPLEEGVIDISKMKYSGVLKVKMGDTKTLRNEFLNGDGKVLVLKGSFILCIINRE